MESRPSGEPVPWPLTQEAEDRISKRRDVEAELIPWNRARSSHLVGVATRSAACATQLFGLTAREADWTVTLAATMRKTGVAVAGTRFPLGKLQKTANAPVLSGTARSSGQLVPLHRPELPHWACYSALNLCCTA